MKNGKPVVLVVEDSAIIRMSAVDLVLSAGYEALEAGDAEAGNGKGCNPCLGKEFQISASSSSIDHCAPCMSRSAAAP
mgnify:CR=1 FL=1